MGILNVTPDSFSDGGRFVSTDSAFRHIDSMISAGAHYIDIGAESTRPGASSIDEDEQIRRLDAVIPIFRSKFNIPFSIDTTSANVAEYALSHGASIVNDVSNLRADPKMAPITAKYNATLILNHSRATPKTMQLAPHYSDTVAEVIAELTASIAIAQQAGVQSIIVDPGIGFGKQLQDNLLLLRHINQFKALGYPILVGPSRKSFISQITNEPGTERLAGTIASVLWCATQGVDIVRVHDVPEIQRALNVYRAIASTL